MNLTRCDKCETVIPQGLAYVWHRRLPHDQGTGHFDLCEYCDLEVMAVINSPETVAYTP